MKKMFKILLGFAIVFVLGLTAVFFFTSDMVTVADEFFVAAGAGDLDKAYQLLSEDFQNSVTREQLSGYLAANSLDTYQQAHWNSRSVNGNRGELVGSITTLSGGTVPVTCSFVKGESGWKIYSIQKPVAGFSEEHASRQLPSEEEQIRLVIRLVAESIHVFVEAVHEKSMARLHAHASNLWQQQVTVARLDEAFNFFYGIEGDLRVLNNLSPQFDQKASIDEDGLRVNIG